MLTMLEAENAASSAFKGSCNPEVVRSKYDDAIALAGRSGFVHDAALANEMAGSFFWNQENYRADNSVWANTYLTRAHSLYEEWQAHAKATHLRELYPSLFSVQLLRV
mmetsp:Transcript_19745/g.43975  ORF Transcript_19745/g.43975 Transcript_19745/m.43975 type:complete len:108 (-) Transcript_19745:280-603(-)